MLRILLVINIIATVSTHVRGLVDATLCADYHVDATVVLYPIK